jgi:hypothetical protein
MHHHHNWHTEPQIFFEVLLFGFPQQFFKSTRSSDLRPSPSLEDRIFENMFTFKNSYCGNQQCRSRRMKQKLGTFYLSCVVYQGWMNMRMRQIEQHGRDRAGHSTVALRMISERQRAACVAYGRNETSCNCSKKLRTSYGEISNFVQRILRQVEQFEATVGLNKGKKFESPSSHHVK